MDKKKSLKETKIIWFQIGFLEEPKNWRFFEVFKIMVSKNRG